MSFFWTGGAVLHDSLFSIAFGRDVKGDDERAIIVVGVNADVRVSTSFSRGDPVGDLGLTPTEPLSLSGASIFLDARKNWSWAPTHRASWSLCAPSVRGKPR